MLLYVVMINLRAVFSWKFPWNFCAAFAPQWDIDDSGAVNCSCINSHYLPACYLVFQKVQHKDRLVIRSSCPSHAGVSPQVAGRARGETGADGPSAVSVQWFKTHFWNDKIVKSKTLLIPERDDRGTGVFLILKQLHSYYIKYVGNVSFIQSLPCKRAF